MRVPSPAAPTRTSFRAMILKVTPNVPECYTYFTLWTVHFAGNVPHKLDFLNRFVTKSVDVSTGQVSDQPQD